MPPLSMAAPKADESNDSIAGRQQPVLDREHGGARPASGSRSCRTRGRGDSRRSGRTASARRRSACSTGRGRPAAARRPPGPTGRPGRRRRGGGARPPRRPPRSVGVEPAGPRPRHRAHGRRRRIREPAGRGGARSARRTRRPPPGPAERDSARRPARPGDSRCRRGARGGRPRGRPGARGPGSGEGRARSSTGAAGSAPSRPRSRGPGRSQTALGTPTRPMSCRRPGDLEVAGLSAVSPVSRAAAEASPATCDEWPSRNRPFRSTTTASARLSVRSPSGPTGARARGSARRTAARASSACSGSRRSSAARRNASARSGSRCRPTAGRPPRSRRRAPRVVGEHGLLAHVDDADGQADVVAADPAGKAVPVPPLVHVVERIGDPGREPEARGQRVRDSAGGPHGPRPLHRRARPEPRGQRRLFTGVAHSPKRRNCAGSATSSSLSARWKRTSSPKNSAFSDAYAVQPIDRSSAAWNTMSRSGSANPRDRAKLVATAQVCSPFSNGRPEARSVVSDTAARTSTTRTCTTAAV